MNRFADRIEVLSRTGVWGIEAGPRVACVDAEGASRVLRPRAVVLATGAHEYVPPFPGWDLPGVMTPGAAQILVKNMGVSPGERIVLAGSGPFLLAVACQLLDRGIRPVAVLEASAPRDWLALPVRGWRDPRVLVEGVGYLARLRREGVRVRYRRVVVEAEGNGVVARVHHARVDADWHPDLDTRESMDVDALCLGYGFVPRAQLAQLAGCELTYRAGLGGWVASRDRELATSVAGIFAAGDGAGVGGARAATLEGRLAGLSASRRIGAIDDAELARRRTPLVRDLARGAPLRAALAAISLPRPGLQGLMLDDTIVCRCEEVPWRDVRDAIHHGGRRTPEIKTVTRLGMGPCQGRFCWPAAARYAAHELGCAPDALGPARARPPAHPITLGALAEMEGA